MKNLFLKTLLLFVFSFSAISQKLSVDMGFKFNNDFSIVYKDLKPFYVSGLAYNFLWKKNRSEYIFGVRHMPFLNTINPEFGFNYYLSPDKNAQNSYYFHTSFFYNNYSYNTLDGYENYNKNFIGVKPLGYNEVFFTSFTQDLAIGFNIGLSGKLSWKALVGGGYYYGRNDKFSGTIFEKSLKQKYFGAYYTIHFSLKYLLYNFKKESNEDLLIKESKRLNN